MNTAEQSPLGKAVTYSGQYNPTLLYPIPRADARNVLGLNPEDLPFKGCDIWHAYEVSWLGLNGQPEVALATFYFPCDSIHLIESKSFKLYLNSFSQTQIATINALRLQLVGDLSAAVGSAVEVTLSSLDEAEREPLPYRYSGQCIDNKEVSCDIYLPEPDFLHCEGQTEITESLYSHLLKSNCPVTGQPDWASIHIHYQGRPISHAGLLRYIVSYRNHTGFHESCTEQMFLDIKTQCAPRSLTLYACYTRRGGLDINMFRSTHLSKPKQVVRLVRQ